ncbi:MAG: hypothetical protein HZA00_12255 [Nitrospinae bacterium]|nr:hypothetical protein [Nitrospinota bacterium]
MTREEAARIYLEGLMDKNVQIEKYFEAARVLSAEDKSKLHQAITGYKTPSEITITKIEGDSF